MQAALLKKGQNSLVIEDVSVPEVADNEVLVQVKACGVCHTDLHYIDHGIRTVKEPPIILGHEASGVVTAIGKAVNNLLIGDRVLIPAVLTCGVCKYCRSGKENICANMKMLGNHIDGAYSEYIALPSKDLQVLPDEITFEEGAVISDALSTAYHAVFNRACVKKDEYVIIIGCGGVGSSILQMVLLQTANVIVFDISTEKLEKAKEFGAKEALNPMKEDVFTALKAFAPDGIDVIFEVVGLKQNFELALKLAAPASRICTVGYISEKAALNCAKLMFFELDIIGSLGCKVSDLSKVMDLVIEKKIDAKKLITRTYPLDAVNRALDDIRQSRGLRQLILFK